MGLALVLGAALIGSGIALTNLVKDRALTALLLRADPDRIAEDKNLLTLALNEGPAVFANHCASCHGADGKGDRQRAAPDLTDSDWLYGTGTPGEIEKIVAHGIRAHNSRTWNLAEMPAYGRPRPSRTSSEIKPLTPAELRDVTEFVWSLDGRASDPAARARGMAIFQGKSGCNDCHGSDARGDAAIGAPNLTDTIWLYSDGSRDAIARTIAWGLEGVCPGRSGKLSAAAMRQVSVYVHALSHGLVPHPSQQRVPTSNGDS